MVQRQEIVWLAITCIFRFVSYCWVPDTVKSFDLSPKPWTFRPSNIQRRRQKSWFFIEKFRIGDYTIYCVVRSKSSCRNKRIGFWDTFYLSLALKGFGEPGYITDIKTFTKTLLFSMSFKIDGLVKSPLAPYLSFPRKRESSYFKVL
jgi:hypothetical protein